MTKLKPGDWARIKINRAYPVIIEGEIQCNAESFLRLGAYGVAQNGQLHRDVELLDHRPASELWREARYVETDQHQYAKHPDGRDTWLRINPDLDLRRLWLKTEDLICECASGVPRIIVGRDGHIVGDRS